MQKTYNEWEVLEYKGNGLYRCRCSCGVERDVREYDLVNNKSKSCGHTRTLTGKKIGKLKVIRPNGDKTYHCVCECGQEEDIRGTVLRSKKVLMCKRCRSLENIYSKYEKEIAQRYFNDWELIEYIPDKFKWRCRCTCGNESFLHISQLINGTSKSCGHGKNKFIDLTDKKFGKLKVLRYSGYSSWTCLCECGNTCIKTSRQLRSNSTIDCGCGRLKELQNNSTIERSEEQKLAVLSKDNLSSFIGDCKPTMLMLSKMLGLAYSTTVKLVNKYELQDRVKICSGTSYKEQALLEYIQSIYGGSIVTNNRELLNGLELDIYLPDKHIAFEFNGSYWHSDIFKDKDYHQNKVLLCEKLGVHLIHIYEYEWDNEYTRSKLKDYIRNVINGTSHKIYARQTVVMSIDDSVLEHEFEDTNHLQGYTKSSIKLGLFHDNKLVQLMTFGKPRFDSQYDYEVIRICTMSDTWIIGGNQKLFKYFCDNYDFHSLVSYCNIDKFVGSMYSKLGFKLDSLSTPGYVWVNLQTGDVLSRYQCQKQRLLKLNPLFEGMTESQIMDTLGYFRVYNSGNKKYIYKKGEKSHV